MTFIPLRKLSDQLRDEEEIIEKIDIGGISLIRAAAKNYNDVLIVSEREQYAGFLQLLEERNGTTSPDIRRHYAAEAFKTTSSYDTAIFRYFNRNEGIDAFRESIDTSYHLRYGENPHQKGNILRRPGTDLRQTAREGDFLQQPPRY